MKTYITYGKGNKFNKSKLPSVEELNLDLKETRCINKVMHTLWGSPIDAIYGWKDWCENEDFKTHLLSEDNSFKWTLKPEAKVLYINDIKDIDNVPFIKEEIEDIYSYRRKSTNTNIDFKTIIKDLKYDAMEICMDNGYIGHMFISAEEMCFNTWDCDSIMVFNKDMVVPVVE